MNIVECAIKMEEEARIHYEKLAETTSDEELKRLFKLLAASEQEHHAALIKLKEGLAAEKDDFSVFSEGVCVFRPLIDTTNLRKELENDSDAYLHVVKEEEESISLYDKLAEETTDEAVRRVVTRLAEEERRHLKVIENIYSFMEAPKTYLEWGEFGHREL
ncbi:MAG: ferritin family protein [Deltaproteobacteria bacterium]|nr:ferritin family protein [Deltaproteobacteria bacterium]